MSKLRPHQQAAFARLTDLVTQGARRILVIGATGVGKGTFAAHLLKLVAKRGNGGLFVAHREELVQDLSQRLTRMGVEHGVIQADAPRLSAEAPIQVASVQTLARRPDQRPRASVLILDECHRAAGASFKKVIDSYPDAIVIGASATPYRLDSKPLGSLFDHVVVIAQTQELIDEGWLVSPKIFVPDTPDVSDVPTVAGDYQSKGAAAAMAPLTGNIVKTWAAAILQRPREGHLQRLPPTIVFAQNVAHSKALVARFREAGADFVHLDASTPRAQRRAALADLASGAIDGISQVALFVEGWDLPQCEIAIIARLTQSRSLHRQMAGRVLRPFCPLGSACPAGGRVCSCPSAKRGARIFDHAGNTVRLGLITDKEDYTEVLTVPERRAGKKDVPPVPVRICLAPGCFSAYSGKLAACPECGTAAPVRPRELPKEGAGELTELSPAKAFALRAADEALVQTLAKFLRKEREGKTAAGAAYRKGYARCAWKGMTGRWPSEAQMQRAGEIAERGRAGAV